MNNGFQVKSSNSSNYSDKKLEIVSPKVSTLLIDADSQNSLSNFSSSKSTVSSINTQATQSHELEPNDLVFGDKQVDNDATLSLNVFNLDTEESEPVNLGSNVKTNTNISTKYSNQLINLSIEFQDSMSKILTTNELNEFNAIVDKYKDSAEMPSPEESAKIKNILNKLKSSDTNISAEAKNKLTEYENSFNSIEGENLQYY